MLLRDPFGFRPLCYGQRSDGSYVVASETCALNTVNAEYIRDIEPGEILVFDKDGIRSIKITATKNHIKYAFLNTYTLQDQIQ